MPLPVHCQIKLEPSVVTAVGVPVLQRFVVGALLKVPLFAEPHAPFITLPDELPELEAVEPDELDPLDEPPLELPEVPETVPELEPEVDPELDPLDELPVTVPLEPPDELPVTVPLELPELELPLELVELQLPPVLEAEPMPLQPAKLHPPPGETSGVEYEEGLRT